MRSVVALVALFAASPSPAQSPADLFPPTTLAYAEVRGPALADGVTALVAGTPWADSLAALPDLLDAAHSTDAEARETANLALMTAPEALAEVRRTRGAAVGLLGYSAKGTPRYAAVVLTGESGLAALAVRRLLTADPALRRVATLDGVAAYQNRGPTRPAAPGDAKPFPPGEDEPTYAAVPGLLVVGSGVDVVRDVVGRYKRAGQSPSLAGVAAYRAVPAPAGTVATLYATPAAYFAASDRARKPGTPDPLGVARFLFDVPRWATVTGHVILQADRVELTLTADFEKLPPLVEALLGPDLPADGLARVRRPSQSDFALTVPAGEGRVARWLALADAVAAGRGHLGRKPSRLVADLDRDAKGTSARDLLGTVGGLSVALGGSGPVAVAHLDGSPLAGRWPQELPRLLTEVLGKSGGVSSALAGGTRLVTLQWGDGEPRSRLTVAVTPQAIFVAEDPAAVEAMLKAPPTAAGLPQSRGAVHVPTLLQRLRGPAAAAGAPPAAGIEDDPLRRLQVAPVAQAVGVGGGGIPPPLLDGLEVAPPAQPVGGFDLLVRRLRPLPLLAVDAAATPGSPNRVTVTVRLPDAKAALRRLFEMPKPVAPAEPPAKDAEEPVAPAPR